MCGVSDMEGRPHIPTTQELIEQGYLTKDGRAVWPKDAPVDPGTAGGIPFMVAPPKAPKVIDTAEKSLYLMMAEVRANNSAKGWRQTALSFGDHIALLHSEVSEALEAYRIHKMAPYTSPDGKPNDVYSEIADLFIRVLDFCDLYGIDLQREYERKMAYNRTRDFRHGGKAL